MFFHVVHYSCCLQIFGLCLGFLHKELSHERRLVKDGLDMDGGGELPRRLQSSDEGSMGGIAWKAGYEKLGSGIELWSVSDRRCIGTMT